MAETDIIQESITALGHLYGEIKGTRTAVQLNDSHYVNKKTIVSRAGQRAFEQKVHIEVNLLNQVAPAGLVSIEQRMRHFVAIMGSLGPRTIHRFLNTYVAYVGDNILQTKLLRGQIRRINLRNHLSRPSAFIGR